MVPVAAIRRSLSCPVVAALVVAIMGAAPMAAALIVPLILPLVVPSPAFAQRAPVKPDEAALPGDRIVAVVNNDVISSSDVNARTRSFALSTGMPTSPEVLGRLKPQIVRQLIDERLRMQEAQRRKVVIPDQQIAGAIRDIEQRNGMPTGTLRHRLSVDGIGQRTLVSQIRTQLAWTQVLREQLADRANIPESEVDDFLRLQAQLVGRQEFRVGEIFIPIDDPKNTADAQRFAETVIGQLRAGAPFPMVAAQFSQTQSALEGGEVGWVTQSQLDPSIARMVTEMPPGAISNPVKVPGGFSIVTLQGKRELGRDLATAVSVRQVFLPFSAPLNPQAPTDQQRQLLEKARGISGSVRSCEQMEEVARANNSPRPPDPGEIKLETVSPPGFRQLLGSLPIGRASEPLVSVEGIAVMIVCSREQKNMASMSKGEAQRQLLNERVELLSRQMMRDLRRQATIEQRGGA